MSDPLSIATSVAGLLSLGIQVTQTLVDFYTVYKHRVSDLALTAEKLEGLLHIFKSLDQTLSSRSFRDEESDLIKTIETSITRCEELITDLQSECQKFDKASSSGIKASLQTAGRRATYPFRKSTLQSLDEIIGELRDNLFLAVDVLQLRDTKLIQDDITDTRQLLDLVRDSQIASEVRDWLEAPDATVNHNAACAARHPGTGAWLVKSPVFSDWLVRENSFLWLYGFPGCGKSVLCSTAIQHAFRHRRSDPSIGIAFFYFTFDDESKQDESAMVRALLLQLSGQLSSKDMDLARLYQSYGTGTAPSPVLVDCLQRTIQKFQHVYIALDALDESPRNGARDCVLETLETMRKWSFRGLHLLATSRDEPDIRDALDLSQDQQVKMENDGINKDIANFVSKRLRDDRRLKKWSPYQAKIQETLSERAKGVFRWVECQLKSLKSCPCSEDHLDQLLNSLPQSLDETYERILSGIDPVLRQDAQRILTLLCFSARSLRVRELIDGIAIDIDNERLNKKRRLQGIEDIQEICPSLIDFDSGASLETGHDHVDELEFIVRIAHFSVQEYLESDRIRTQKASMFSLTSAAAHAEIAQIYLIYLLELRLDVSKLERRSHSGYYLICPSADKSYKSAQNDLVDQYPLAYHAAMNWHRHYVDAGDLSHKLDASILKLFTRWDSFLCWADIYDLFLHSTLHSADLESWNWRDADVFNSTAVIASPIYFATLFGLTRVFGELMKSKRQDDVLHAQLSTKHSQSANFTTLRRFNGSSLQEAQMLFSTQLGDMVPVLKSVCEVQRIEYGSALQVASLRGYKAIVEKLLEIGVMVDLMSFKAKYDGSFGNALQMAIDNGQEDIARLLLDHGADPNVQSSFYGNALQTASWAGNEWVVRLLLEKGANVNTQGGKLGSALQAASVGRSRNIVELLLENGADINAAGGHYGNALQAASAHDNYEIMRLLLGRGADVKIQASQGNFGYPLQVASRRDDIRTVRLLLQRGADVDVRDGYALKEASASGNMDMVQLLLKSGADVETRDRVKSRTRYSWYGRYQTPLQAATRRGHIEVVRILLKSGADIDAWDGMALREAAGKGHKDIVQLLLEKGTDVKICDRVKMRRNNTRSDNYQTPLQAAARKNHTEIVRILLESGVDINARNGLALRVARREGRHDMVQLLLENGAHDTSHAVSEPDRP